MLRKLFLLLASFCMVLTVSANGWAYEIAMGEYKLTFEGFSYFDSDNAALGNPEEIWAIATVTSMTVDTDANGSYDHDFLEGETNELFLVFEGIEYDVDQSSPGQLAYFTDIDSDSFVKIYESPNFDDYDAAVVAGPGTTGNAGSDPGDYATDLVTNGNLMLEFVFAQGGVWIDEQDDTDPGNINNAEKDDVYRTIVTGQSTNSTLGYLDVVDNDDAEWTDLFLLGNSWFNDSDLLDDVGRTYGYDANLLGSNLDITDSNPSGENAWPVASDAGWTTYVDSATTHMRSVVPEPNTMLLFGFGLLGLARISRRKK